MLLRNSPEAMKAIQKLYNEHLNTPFPDLRGEEIDGIDLVMLDSDIAGLVQTFFAHRGQLNGDDFKILNHCYSDLKIVVRELENKHRLYFSNLLNIVEQIIELEATRKQRTDSNQNERNFN